jgi:NAD-dependent dihydropyrimidine dehydrogenase PreA subunit
VIWKEPVEHSVCTKDEAKEAARGQERFWVSTCWCRESMEKCLRSGSEVCISFREDAPVMADGRREISLEDVLELIEDARDRGLISRTFIRKGGDGRLDGLCLCCDDCCMYFTGRAEEKPARGRLIERTLEGCCSSCGMCERACLFDARQMDEGELVVIRYRCYGCGVCADTCPTSCIEMEDRRPRQPAGAGGQA